MSSTYRSHSLIYWSDVCPNGSLNFKLWKLFLLESKSFFLSVKSFFVNCFCPSKVFSTKVFLSKFVSSIILFVKSVFDRTKTFDEKPFYEKTFDEQTFDVKTFDEKTFDEPKIFWRKKMTKRYTLKECVPKSSRPICQ